MASVLPSIQKLCELFGVSRTVVREALRDLAARGLIRIVNGRGAIVQETGEEPLQASVRRVFESAGASRRDGTDIQRLLGGYAAARAAVLRSDEDIARLRTLLARMAAEIERPEGYGAVATEFHMAVARIASNEFLILLIDSIRVALDGAEETSPRTVDRRIVHRAQSLHERIADSIERGDASEAERSMYAYFDLFRAVPSKNVIL